MKENISLIITKRLLLRPLNLNDLVTVYEYASDIENTKYMMHLPYQTIEETELFLQKVTLEWKKDNPDFYEWAIILNNIHIGSISIYLDKNNKEGELGWIINKKYQKKGYATEAAIALLEIAKKELKLKKVTAHCDYRNKASYRVMCKIGMVLKRDDIIRKYKNEEKEYQEFMCSKTFD